MSESEKIIHFGDSKLTDDIDNSANSAFGYVKLPEGGENNSAFGKVLQLPTVEELLYSLSQLHKSDRNKTVYMAHTQHFNQLQETGDVIMFFGDYVQLIIGGKDD